MLAEPRFGTKGNFARPYRCDGAVTAAKGRRKRVHAEEAAAVQCAMADVGHPIESYVLRPSTNSEPRSFKGHGMSSSSLNARFKKHLNAANLCKCHMQYTS